MFEFVEIKKLSSCHVKEMIEIETLTHISPWSLNSLTNIFSQARYITLGAFVDDHLVGYIIFDIIFDESNLENIAVSPIMQNNHIGSKLLENYFMVLKEHKVIKSFLEVRASNSRAIHLYSKYKYNTISVRKGYYKNGNLREDAFVMQCIIDENCV